MGSWLCLLLLVPAATPAPSLSAEAPAAAPVAALATHLVFLDPGHSAKHPGALSAVGVTEVTYNDALTRVVADRLTASGEFVPRLTRRPGEELPLRDRSRRANEAKADVLLSIHHDSANEQYLKRVRVGGRPARRSLPKLRQRFSLGFSIFVSDKNPRYDDSLRLAKALGKELVALGRKPSTHHNEAIAHEGRKLLVPELGIYRYDDLNVLANAEMPAVLVEVGVIVDEEELAYLDAPGSSEDFGKAVLRALEAYFATKGSGPPP